MCYSTTEIKLWTHKPTVHTCTQTPKAENVVIIMSDYSFMRSLLFSSQQVAERRPLFFVCPSFTAGAPREFPQRDPGNVLLPGGGDISQPCITDQLSLRSPSLYEESLLQHWDHVSKRNKFVGPIHRQGDMNIHDVRGWI